MAQHTASMKSCGDQREGDMAVRHKIQANTQIEDLDLVDVIWQAWAGRRKEREGKGQNW